MRRKSRKSRRKRNELELRRQFVHAAGVLLVFVILFVERPAAALILGGSVLVLIALAFYRARIKLTSKWLEKFVLKRERRGEYPLKGAIYFFLGAFLAFEAFAPAHAAAGVAVLALADAAATLAGNHFGAHKLPVNKKKSWEGSVAFLAVCFAVLLFFVQPQKALAVAALTMFIEMLPRIDDNITIPLAVGLFLTIL